MGNNKSKVFIIGLDGGTWTVFKPLMEEGLMPNLAKLVKNGVSGILKSTIPPVTAPAWTSFQTGVNPGKHGLYDFIEYKTGTYDWHLTTSHRIRIKTIWEIASEIGKTVVSINVPMTYPPKEVKGAIIAGIMSPSTDSKFTYPSDLYQELVNEIQEYIIYSEPRILFTNNLEKAINKLIYIEKKRIDASLYLMKKFKWDLFMVHNQSLDQIQHILWPYIYKEHPKFKEEKWKIISKFYKSLDDSIGKILSELSNSATLVIMSDHGFGNLDKNIHLNKLLQMEGYQKLTNIGQIGKIERLIKKLDIFKLRKKFRFNLIDRTRVKLNQTFSLDWSKTKAFMGTGQIYGHIYLNVKDREKMGTITPDEYETIRTEIQTKLIQFKDPFTGNFVVERVYKREEIYKGSETINAPDLIIKPSKGYAFTKRLNEPGPISICKSKNDFLGTHTEDGIIIFSGNLINLSKNIEYANMVDIMPTIMHILDMKVPDYIDGKILYKILSN